jgi:hypothetical protein
MHSMKPGRLPEAQRKILRGVALTYRRRAGKHQDRRSVRRSSNIGG